MTRNQKVAKLGNAIREFRGAYAASTGKWIRPPKVSAFSRVTRWLSELGVPQEQALATIQSFKNFGEMQTWIAGL